MNIRKNIDYSQMYQAIDDVMARKLPQLQLYCAIGRIVCTRCEKGAAVMASEYIKARHPEVHGFSPRNLRRMRDFCRTYENHPVLLSLAMNLSWTQNVVIMEADLTMELREWYLRAAQQFGWSKAELIAKIVAEAHLEIVLENKKKMCDNSDSETDISRDSVIVYDSYFLKHLLRRHIIQQRCRGRPKGYPLSEYGSCIEIWQRRISKKLTTSPRLQRPRLRSYRFRETAVKLHCGDINVRKMPEQKHDYFPEYSVPEAGYLMPFGDGPAPIYKRRVGKSVIQNMLNQADRYVYMMSPYLIIDNELCQAIENAALRGVNVKLILPHVPDKKIILEMARSYYHRLMEAGVEVYEYEPGFVHAKVYLADDEYGMVGTINLDYRSLVHHFENGVWMYRCECLKDIREDFTQTFSRCIPMDKTKIKWSLPRRFLRAVLKVFTPML